MPEWGEDEAAGAGRERAYVAPRSGTEQVVAEIWSGVLGQERIGGEDEFFELGGHSLLATQIVSRVRETFGVEVGLREFFAAPTVRGQAAAIQRAQAVRQRSATAPPVRPRLPGSEPRLSYAQERLWFVEQLVPGNCFYNIAAALRLHGPLHPACLAQSLTEVMRRHHSLRTRFLSHGGEPLHDIAPALPLPLPVVDLSPLPDPHRQTLLHQLAEQEARRPFRLQQGPPWRARLLRLDPQLWVVLVTVHHMVADGWSLGLLLDEVVQSYAAFQRGLPLPLPELELQYADFALWQRQWMQGEVLQRELLHWRQRLHDCPALTLPTDHPRPALQSYRGARLPLHIDAPLCHDLKDLSRRHGTTLFMTLAAAFALLLSRYSSQSDFAIGTPIANRNRKEIEGLIGFFVNLLVLRLDLSGRPSFQQLLQRVREVCLDAYAHQDLPFEKLVAELQPARDLSRHPLFQVAFGLENARARVRPPNRAAPGRAPRGAVRYGEV